MILLKKRINIILLVASFLMAASVSAAHADDEWKVYASYHNATKAVKADSRIFVLANGNLFSYDSEDNSVCTYDKTNLLSDIDIYDIGYSASTKQLVVLYANGNIDLIGMNGVVWNLPDMKKKSLSDKTLNELKIVNTHAFISLNSGLVHIDLAKRYFVNLYTFDTKVSNANMQGDKLYVKTSSGIMEGDVTANLSNKGNWKTLSAAPVAFGLTQAEKDEAASMLEKVDGININSPIRNISYKLNMQGERLLVAGGAFSYSGVSYPGTAMVYESGKWAAFDEEKAIELVGAKTYYNVTDVVQDPDDPAHHWLGTMRSGIYEFRDLQLVNHYTFDNSPLKSILPNSASPQNFVRVTALNYDGSGNLWMCNNECDTIVRILKKDGKWKSLYISSIAGKPTFDHTVFDRRGWAWMVCRRTTNQKGASGFAIINANGTIDNTADDHYKYLSTIVNQNGERYTPDLCYCVTEDLNGAIWLGCTQGIFMSSAPDQVFETGFTMTQPIVPRNDGSGLGDYLLNGVPVKCIAVDGGNRKWIGTLSNGIYLISADGMETIEHFTEANSPLISDEINDIAINGSTGEVFIATAKGLCSFQGDATDPAASLKSDNLKVFPNPVRPEYNGNVHITGLMSNSVVKIVSASGNLVTEGTSIGGEYSWNCCYATGKRVASGIYYALCTDEEGKENACAKILVIK